MSDKLRKLMRSWQWKGKSTLSKDINEFKAWTFVPETGKMGDNMSS